jgi:putative PEP-CTERM system TPR-repeat lipoprotein
MMQSVRFVRLPFMLAAACLVIAGCKSESSQSLIDSGKALSAKNDYNGAAIQFKAALQQDPSLREARILLGQALLGRGDPSGAIVELTKALDEKAPLSVVIPPLSRALLLAGEYKKLVNTYGDLSLEDKPAQAALKANVATAWAALGDRAKTEIALGASLAAQPDYGPARLLNARILAGKRQFDEATAVVDAALASNARYFEAWLLRGEILEFAKSDLKGAEEAYRKALAIDKAYMPAHAALIAMRIRQRDMAGAKAQADQLRTLLPDHPYSVMVDAQLAYLDNDLARARELVQKLLRAFPDNQPVLVLGGAIEAQLGAVQQAAAFFGKALQLNPSLDVARRNLAESEIRLGQYSKAMETLGPLLGVDPPKAEVLSLAGDAELRLGNAEAAEAYFARAAKLDPSNLRLQTAAAMSRLRSGDAAQALADLQTLSAKSQDTYADEALFAAHMKRREFDAALQVLDAMTKKQPGKASHLELRGRVHLARNDLVAARQAFEQAQKADPAMFAAVSNQAIIDMLESKPAQAVARLQAAVAANPRNMAALLALAELKSRQGGSIDEVKKLFADAVAVSPTAAEPRLRQIDFALRKRLTKDALAAAQDALAALPNDSSILEAVGKAQAQSGDLQQATNTFRKLAAAEAGSPRPYLQLADVYLAAGKKDQAEAAIRKALEIDPDQPAAQNALVNILVTTNRQRDAVEYFRRMKQARPTQPLGYILEAAYHARVRENDAAAQALREGLAKTGSSDIAGKLYSLLLLVGRSAEAEKFGSAWIKQHPSDAAFDYLLAVSDIGRGDTRSAEERLRRVIAAFPGNALALNNMAWVLLRNGKPGAVAYAQRAVGLLPDRPALLDTLALALSGDKQYGAALDTQKRAVELAPEDSGLRFNLARLALQAGDKALARDELKRLKGLGAAFGGQAEVDKMLQSL